MKRFIIFLICLALLSGCTSVPEKSEGLSVVSVSFPGYSFAKEIAGENADITLLLPLGSEAHGYEPTPKDIIKIRNCDLFIYGGGESEVWVKEILSSVDENVSTLAMTDCVDLLHAEVPKGAEHHHDHSDEIDPHVWTSPKNAIKITREISDILCKKDEKNAEIYKNNAENYIEKLTDLDNAFSELETNGKYLVMGDRFPFLYLAKEYNISYFAAFPGCSGETEAGASTIAELIDTVKRENIPAIFHTEFSNKKVCDTIAEETGARSLMLHSCHNVSMEDFENDESYLSLMQKNLENLKEVF